MKKLIALIATITIVIPMSSRAHDNHAHKTTDAVKKEQKEWGIAGDAKSVKRTIKISMSDTMRFTPDKFEVKQGETIKIVLKNEGKMLHEMVIGTKKELDAHAALMLKFPNMEHEEPYMAHVPTGKISEIIWTFNNAGEFEFACLIPGHDQGGMFVKIIVTAR